MTEERLFSRLVRVDHLPREGQVVTIEATPAERKDLASFYRLPDIAVLTATLRLEPWGRGGARATGAVHGELTQVCIVSLEPFPATVDEDVDVRFAPQTAADRKSSAEQEAQTFSLADEDGPDPVIDGKIDLGALTAEFFALGLDPYPRKPGAVLDEERTNSGPTDSPFAALAQRDKPGSN
jgi:Large ribosomal RNA subunit accumulation protein YceD